MLLGDLLLLVLLALLPGFLGYPRFVLLGPVLPLVMEILLQPLIKTKIVAGYTFLENDPSIVSRILKTVNSAFYSSPGAEKIVNIQQAVTHLGFKEIQNIAISSAIFGSFDKLSPHIFDRKSFWRHCVCTAFLGMEMAVVVRSPVHAREDVFHLTGLIHDLGKILLEAYFPELLEQCIKAALQTKQPLYLMEQKFLGLDHMEIGSLLVEKWNLPEVAASVVRWHHDPQRAPQEHRTVVEVVRLANYIANTEDLGTGGDIGGPVFQREVWESLGISPAVIPDLVRKVIENESNLLDVIH